MGGRPCRLRSWLISIEKRRGGLEKKKPSQRRRSLGFLAVPHIGTVTCCSHRHGESSCSNLETWCYYVSFCLQAIISFRSGISLAIMCHTKGKLQFKKIPKMSDGEFEKKTTLSSSSSCLAWGKMFGMSSCCRDLRKGREK